MLSSAVQEVNKSGLATSTFFSAYKDIFLPDETAFLLLFFAKAKVDFGQKYK